MSRAMPDSSDPYSLMPPKLPLPPKLSSAGRRALDALLHQRVASRTLPALHFGATTSAGTLYLNCAGDRVFGEPEKGQVDRDTTFQFYSATKLVTSVAVLQAVERGEVDLDDKEVVHRACPELNKHGILAGFDAQDQPIMVPRKGKFTLKNLLAHTSGMSYPRLNPVLGKWQDVTGHPIFWTGTIDAFNKPTLFEPGTRWQYGLGVDWAGIVLERVTKRSLEDIFQKDIFRPLGISSTELSFYPNPNTVPRIQTVCKRNDAGEIVHSPPIVSPHRTPEEIGQLSGGGGLYGTTAAYLRFLRGVLASARGDGSGVLSKASYEKLFENCLPAPGENGNTCTEDIYIAAGEQVSNDPANVDLGRMEHSVGFPMTTVDSPHGRRAGSGAWGGAGQTLFWIDPRSDLAGICFTQLRCPNPDPYFETYNEFERTLYDNLE